ncbi:hypothetical protein PR202_ga13575 [Eleusine coracana subsp. coracana]|uniref:Uncharacterized protein n=1 Tax=Eleusine coracana subsp. coracana TaxID=191504 RepID=A0AAV5CEH2_ELECO|nr:hypothetical protein QOZ80_3AG0214980 [Eleusine coracana subsp. coracana]GJM96713.1 hypothetical protein PR202_ga13575 [Eleusine coracana subsp. coracana]
MPMEQAFRHCDKDTLKMAMLKHEETFRQQVHELHRLYRIQKLLMRDLNREFKNQRNVSTSPNGGGSIGEHRRGGVCSYEQRYAMRGRGHVVAAAMAAPRTALSLDVLPPAAVEYVRSTEDDDDDEAEETDDEAELELTLAVGGGGGKKRYGEYPSSGESLSSSSTESDVLLTAGQEWRQARRVAAGSPCHFKRRPAARLEVEDGVGMQPPPPLLFHWLSLKMA